MSNITNRAGIFMAVAMNFIVTKFASSNQDKFNTITNYLKTPNAQVVLNLVFLQALVVFYAKRGLVPIASNGTADSDDESGDHNRGHRSNSITVPSKLASLIEQTKRNGIRWIPVGCGMLITAHISFDVLFHYKIERSDIRGDSNSRRGGSEPVKQVINFVERIGEFIRSELTD
jgi:hypothetical protein